MKKFYFFIIAMNLLLIGVIAYEVYTDHWKGSHSIVFYIIAGSALVIYGMRKTEQEEYEDSKKCSKKDQEYIENILKIR